MRVAPGVSPTYRPDIDGLRALAVLAVLVFHAFPGALPGGFVGVDVFFVISGYLINGILIGNLERGRLGLGDFYVHRIKRILPALVVMLCGALAAGWILLLQTEYKELGKHVAASATFVVNLVLIGEAGYFDAASEAKPLLHLWSLAVEEQFYIAWPLLLALAWKLKSRPIVLVAMVGTPSFCLCVWLTRVDPTLAFYLPFTRLWELLVGAALSSLRIPALGSSTLGGKHRDALGLVGLALIVLALVALDQEVAFPGYRALLPTIGAVALIAAGPAGAVNRVLLSNRTAVFVGKISYPLYLWHWPVLTFARFANAEQPSPVQRLGLLALSGVLAWLTYLFVERPIRFGPRKPWAFVTPLAALLLLGLVGHNIYTRDGLEFRKANRGVPGMASAADGWYRLHECLLDPKDMDRMGRGQLSFGRACDGTGTGTGRPLILIWGDSHAASLYPGIHAYAEKHGFDVAQFTGSGCPPILGDIKFDKPTGCDKLEQAAFDKISELQPAIIVVAGYWTRYVPLADNANGFYPELRRTLDAVRKLGSARIVLVGHLPTFFDKQAGIGARLFEPGKRDRTYKGFDPRSRQNDAQVRSLAAAAGVTFFSPIDLLCNAQGCLLSTSDRELKPVAWDYGHLTAWGSEYLVDQAARASPELFGLPGASAMNQ